MREEIENTNRASLILIGSPQFSDMNHTFIAYIL